MTTILERFTNAVRRDRLVDTAKKLVAVYSPTGKAGEVLDCLAELLQADGFPVERVAAGHPSAPAVVTRWSTGKPGKTIQFNAHLDTVHLPFVPPAVEGDHLTGSGSCNMKGGFAAAIEALRIFRDTDALPCGDVLLTAHDLHESPWGDGSQLNTMISDGIVGDAVLLPEYLNDRLAVIGRGGFTWNVTIRRNGPPIHEVMRPTDEPSVIAAGAELVRRIEQLNNELASRTDPLAGPETAFTGQIHSGEIFNQYPQECMVEGTRRWLPDHARAEVERHYHEFVQRLATDTGTTIETKLTLMRDAFLLDRDHAIVTAFQEAMQATTGKPLPIGAKPFCDDGNSFWALTNVPTITHGPASAGAHTLNEWVSITAMERVATTYALTAVHFHSEP